MGTNYYWYPPVENQCDKCGRGDSRERLHIGKCSVGWCFGLHVIPEEGLNTLDDWQERWKTGVITNEYGDVVSVDEMTTIVTGRIGHAWWGAKWRHGYNSEAHFHASNYSERGPLGLLRSRIDGSHCVGHGEGTWDYIAGEFS